MFVREIKRKGKRERQREREAESQREKGRGCLIINHQLYQAQITLEKNLNNFSESNDIKFNRF